MLSVDNIKENVTVKPDEYTVYPILFVWRWWSYLAVVLYPLSLND